MKVEVLYVDGCSGHELLLPRVRALAARYGASVELRRVDTAEDAQTERFLGSPTVRVDGEDVDPDSPGGGFGLTCRVYRTEEGQMPVPPDQWIIDALRGAQTA